MRLFGTKDVRQVRTSSCWRTRFIIGLTCALALVWPLPHTIALRNTLMVVLFAVLGPRTDWARAARLIQGPLRAPAILYVSFTLWVLVVATTISPFEQWSLAAINGQWFAAFGALLIGAASAIQEDPQIPSLVTRALLAVLVVQVAAVDIEGFWVTVYTGAWSHMARLGGLTAGPGKASYLTNFLLSGLVAELSLRITGRRTLPLSGRWLAALLVLCLVSVYFEAMRNELFDVMVFAGFIGVIGYRAYTRIAPRRALWLAVGSILTVVIATALDLMLDPRWQTLWATIPIALDTRHNLAWLNPHRFPWPRLPNGQPVSQSNYVRIAWIKEGLKSIIANPLGVGYGRQAFGHALRLRFGNLSTNTGLNNSFLTIAIGTGIPGALLWLGWFGALAQFTVSRFSGPRAFEARFLLLIVLAFGVRMGLDNVMQNYTLEQFMYFSGLLAPLVVTERPLEGC